MWNRTLNIKSLVNLLLGVLAAAFLAAPAISTRACFRDNLGDMSGPPTPPDPRRDPPRLSVVWNVAADFS